MRLSEQIITEAGSTIACEWAFPAPPAGQTFAPDLVEVRRTNAAGMSTALARNGAQADCGAQGGWYFDDAQSPSKILACPDTCTDLQDDRGGKIDVVFGCELIEGCAASSAAAATMGEGADLACEWAIPTPPAGKALDVDNVNVRYVNLSGVGTLLGKFDSETACAASEQGWYYDDAAMPSKILACPETCAQMRTTGVSKVDVLFGCKSIPPPLE